MKSVILSMCGTGKSLFRKNNYLKVRLNYNLNRFKKIVFIDTPSNVSWLFKNIEFESQAKNISLALQMKINRILNKTDLYTKYSFVTMNEYKLSCKNITITIFYKFNQLIKDCIIRFGYAVNRITEFKSMRIIWLDNWYLFDYKIHRSNNYGYINRIKFLDSERLLRSGFDFCQHSDYGLCWCALFKNDASFVIGGRWQLDKLLQVVY